MTHPHETKANNSKD